MKKEDVAVYEAQLPNIVWHTESAQVQIHA